MKVYEKLKKSLDHRPLKPKDPSYLKHLESLLLKLQSNSTLNLESEIKDVTKRIEELRKSVCS